MLTVKQLFADGLDLPEDEIKLVRHVDHMERSILRVVAEGFFDLYQEEQTASVHPFHGCKVILSFLGIEGHKAAFYGAYMVQGSRPFTKDDLKQLPDWLAEAHKDGRPRIRYHLRELETFRAYRRRLIVQWQSHPWLASEEGLAHLRAIARDGGDSLPWVSRGSARLRFS